METKCVLNDEKLEQVVGGTAGGSGDNTTDSETGMKTNGKDPQAAKRSEN